MFDRNETPNKGKKRLHTKNTIAHKQKSLTKDRKILYQKLRIKYFVLWL